MPSIVGGLPDGLDADGDLSGQRTTLMIIGEPAGAFLLDVALAGADVDHVLLNAGTFRGGFPSVSTMVNGPPWTCIGWTKSL